MISNFLRSHLFGDTLKARTLRSSGLTLLNFGGAQFLRLVSNLILTRILFPEAFGLMALVQVVLLGLGMLSVTGVKTAIIQSKRGDDPEFLNTAWMVQIGRGLFLWLLTIVFAGPAATFYEQPQLALLLPVAGFSAVLDGLQSTNMSTANRHLNLGRLTFIEISSQIVSIVVMIVVALATGSVWALLMGVLISQAMKLLLSHTMLPGIRNRPAWNWNVAREIFHFGKYILIGSIAGFLINTGDRAVLGKFVTLTELAVYNIGYFLATVPVMMMHQLGARVLLPLYSRTAATTDPGQIRQRQIARAGLTGAMLAASVFLGVIGDWLIRLLYEPEYHLAGPLMVMIALSYLPTILINAYSQRLLGEGNSRDQTAFTVLQAILQVTILLIGVRHLGLMGAIIAPPLSVLIIYPLIAWLMHRRKSWEPRLDLAMVLFCSAGAGLALWVNDTAVAQVLAGASN